MFKSITICSILMIVSFVVADVSEISSEYLPPVHGGGDIGISHQSSIISEPSNEYLAPEPEPGHSFSQDDGYRYRTAKRYRTVRNRNRRVFRNRRLIYRNRRY